MQLVDICGVLAILMADGSHATLLLFTSADRFIVSANLLLNLQLSSSMIFTEQFTL